MNLIVASPDESANGFVDDMPDSMRYDSHGMDDCSVSGIIRRRMPSSARILDVGCGTGALTVLLNHGLGNEVLGLEPDLVRAAAAARHGFEVVCGQLDDEFVAQHGLFDAIIFSDVLEHVPAPFDLIKLAKRALRPGGKIIASVPNVAHWTVRLRLLFGKFDYAAEGIMDATHLRWFTAKTIRNLFDRSGLQITFMAVSSGTWLPEYRYRKPFRLIPEAPRNRMIEALSRRFPDLFGCQHIIEGIVD